MRRFVFLSSFIFIFFRANEGFAFPEMIRNHYVNCTSCHISPNGGGLLTEYGREISVANLSTWGSEDEAKPFYNLIHENPKDLTIGAFIRGVQTYQNNSQVRFGDYWWMQAELEGAYHFGGRKQWTVDLSLGVSPDVLNGLLPNGASPLTSHRQFVLYDFDDVNSLRAGKFLADYGVYFQDHTIATRQGIGFDEGAETYNLEYHYHGENWSGSLTLDFGRPDDLGLFMEKGAVGNVAYNLNDHDKVGWSVFAGAQNGNSRQLTGPYFLLGFTPHFYFLAESDFQFVQPSQGDSTKGWFTYEKLGYEVTQGVQIYLMGQSFVHAFNGTYQPLAQTIKYGSTTNRLYGVGPGVYWYPRPHFYVQLEVQQQFSEELPSSQTTGFLSGSIYL